jgi:site-specific DNA-methyltransferase (adenine-specific)
MKLYTVIYPDPPWAYDNKRTGGSLKSGSAQRYPVMTTKEICALPVPDLAENNSVLFLWGTVPMLPDAFEVLKYWGYEYKTKITWHKTGRNGLGFWFRGEVEELLLGVRGKVKPFRCQSPNIIEHPVLGHSEKPEAFRQLIERATVNLLGPRIELFARQRVPGWDAWGYDVESDIDLRGGKFIEV